MSSDKEKIYDFLNVYIERNIIGRNVDISRALVNNKSVEVLGTEFKLTCWEECASEGRVFCVELRRKENLILQEVYSLGVIFRGKYFRKLSQEEMWNMGF